MGVGIVSKKAVDQTLGILIYLVSALFKSRGFPTPQFHMHKKVTSLKWSHARRARATTSNIRYVCTSHTSFILIKNIRRTIIDRPEFSLIGIIIVLARLGLAG